MLFSWIRNRVCAAFLDGVSDALSLLEKDDGVSVTVTLPDALAARLRLPAAAADPVPALPAGTSEPVPSPDSSISESGSPAPRRSRKPAVA